MFSCFLLLLFPFAENHLLYSQTNSSKSMSYETVERMCGDNAGHRKKNLTLIVSLIEMEKLSIKIDEKNYEKFW